MTSARSTGVEYAEVAIPAPLSARQRDVRRQPRRNEARSETAAARPFVAWDGEGVTRLDNRHDYVQLASSAGDALAQTTALSTVDIFELVLTAAQRDKTAIHVIYGGRYDFNCWVADIDEPTLRQLYTLPFVAWGRYRLGWRQGKSLFISDGQRSVTIYDTVSFFQCSFVKACDSYLGDRFVHRELIAEQKMLRSSFNTDDLATIIKYNAAELENLVLLMNELRVRLHRVGLRPTRWDGPGAIASALLKREGIQDARDESVPEEVATAARHAYAGGRFEVLRFGHVDRPAYEYDINSAYPAAMRSLPDLSLGRWEYVHGDPGPQPFALYRVSYNDDDLRAAHVPGPLPFRLANGHIRYPSRARGWYWSPEVETARDYVTLYPYMELIVEGAWVFHPRNPDARPFGFIDDLYLKRQALKRAGDGSHVGLKLALNSMYGKLAQQVGWRRGPDGVRIPPYHQLEWAGYITSYARATVLRAAMSKPWAIIAFETDAVFSSEPLDLEISSALGKWEATEFTSLTYIQSGLYFGTLADGTAVDKTRGVDRGTLTREDVLTALGQVDDRSIPAQLTRFTGLGIALAQDMGKWRQWETMSKRMKLEPQGKRVHFAREGGDVDMYCCDNLNVVNNEWHATICPYRPDVGEFSSQFPVEWMSGREPSEDEHKWEREWKSWADGY